MFFGLGISSCETGFPGNKFYSGNTVPNDSGDGPIKNISVDEHWQSRRHAPPAIDVISTIPSNLGDRDERRKSVDLSGDLN